MYVKQLRCSIDSEERWAWYVATEEFFGNKNHLLFEQYIHPQFPYEIGPYFLTEPEDTRVYIFKDDHDANLAASLFHIFSSNIQLEMISTPEVHVPQFQKMRTWCKSNLHHAWLAANAETFEKFTKPSSAVFFFEAKEESLYFQLTWC